MAGKSDKPGKLLLNEKGYNSCKDLILEIGAVVSNLPLGAFLNTIEEVRSKMDELKDISDRVRATDNLDMFERVAKSLQPFQETVHAIAKEVEEKDRKENIKLVEEPE